MVHKNGAAATAIRNARLQAGLTENELARLIGETVAGYGDLESYPDDLFTTVSLRQVILLCRHLGLSPRSTLSVDAPAGSAITAAEVTTAIESRIRELQCSVEEAERRAGWRFAPLLENPESLCDFCNVDALIDLAEWAGIDWRMVLPS